MRKAADPAGKLTPGAVLTSQEDESAGSSFSARLGTSTGAGRASMRRNGSSQSSRAEFSGRLVVVEGEVTLEGELAPGSGSKEPEDVRDSSGSLSPGCSERWLSEHRLCPLINTVSSAVMSLTFDTFFKSRNLVHGKDAQSERHMCGVCVVTEELRETNVTQVQRTKLALKHSQQEACPEDRRQGSFWRTSFRKAGSPNGSKSMY